MTKARDIADGILKLGYKTSSGTHTSNKVSSITVYEILGSPQA